MAATCSSEILVPVYQFCGITLQKKVPLSAEFITTSQMCTRHKTEVYVLQSIKMHAGKENFWHELQNALKPQQSNTTKHTGNAHKRGWHIDMANVEIKKKIHHVAHYMTYVLF